MPTANESAEPSGTENRDEPTDKDSEHEKGPGQGDGETGVETATTTSARAKWLKATKGIMRTSGRLASQLGRPHHHGEQGLGSSVISPEELGSTDDTKLAALFRDESGETPNQSKYQEAMNAEAQKVLQGLRGIRHSSSESTSTSDITYSEPSHTPHIQEGSKPQTDDTGKPFVPGVLSGLLQLQSRHRRDHSTGGFSHAGTESDLEELPKPSHTSTSATDSSQRPPKPKKPQWYNKPRHVSTASLVRASMNMAQVGSSSAWTNADVPGDSHLCKEKKRKKHKKDNHEVKLTVHIADIIMRQRYLMQLCRAFMRYGAPTHRLEEYMQMTARVLDIEAQFMYLPGCMIMSFDDPVTRTGEVKLIRVPQGLDLGRLQDVHYCYKRVTHDMVDMHTAITELTELMDRPPRYPKWLVILLYGVGSAAVGPFAFSARPIDMPIIFVLGCCLGIMQHILAPMSALYSNVFEVTAAILISFLARAFGSIRLPGHSDPIFCYASITEASIALILPGFSVLTSSLELQSHQMIAGSIRLVYTILYSLFLGYGVTVGTTIYGAIDSDATRDTTCARQSIWGSPYTQHFPFVAVYCLIAALINQSKLRQTPMMILIGTSGYVTNYFTTQKLGSSSEVANTVGAFTIGLLANLYSRLWHGNAVSVTIPGIFTLVPSGLASSGSILSAIEYSDAVKNGTADTSGASSGSSLTSLGFGMIQTAIGITVGLFISALVVYPQGKRRSGLFSL
ncbi:hypothetical protein BDV59DRAFT_56633 [Aspergillus ambiguus]|uniref:threonine/serine exporter family protein n=1 Tax=Aspergillus ambiguus TaxID=176160 RepID=UPI003CCD57E9